MLPVSTRDTFTSHGLRCTVQREQIYSALMASEVHPTADELFRAVQSACPGISLATVYNTLEAFTRAGLARRYAPCSLDHNGAYRYDADTTHHAHVMTATGQVRDLPDDLSREVLGAIPRHVLDRIEREMGVKVSRISVEFVEDSTER